MSNSIENVAIIGSGIAGLGFALALKRLDCGVKEITIFDSHDEVGQSMGGPVALTGGCCVLERLGFLDKLKQHGHLLHEITATAASENKITSLLNFQDVIKAPNSVIGEVKSQTGEGMLYSIKRSDLIRDLRASLNENVSGGSDVKVTWKFNRKLTNLVEFPDIDKVLLHFEDGTAEDPFDLVIGADGVRSATRKFTSYPNQSILDHLLISVGVKEKHAFDTVSLSSQYTGYRVVQCISPVTAGSKVLSTLKFDHKHRLNQWIGNGCNALTFAYGTGSDDTSQLQYLLAVIFKDDNPVLFEESPSLAARVLTQSTPDTVRHKLLECGFPLSHELHTLVSASSESGGSVYDYLIRDSVCPLKKWSSDSGRVVLVGDSAHAMAPFLGQGANQVLQDAYCLAMLIRTHNQSVTLSGGQKQHGESGEYRTDKLQITGKRVDHGVLSCLLCTAMTMFAAILWVTDYILYFLMHRGHSRTSVQNIAHKYEMTRKPYTTYITFATRVLGFVLTLGGTFGYALKRGVFYALEGVHLLAVGVYCVPMKPRV